MPSFLDLPTLLRELNPILNPGQFVFLTLPGNQRPDPATMLASVREPEGWSVLVPRESALAAAATAPRVFRCITLAVPSDLEAVGLTARVSQAFALANLPCNVIAGHRHDHLLVPEIHAEAAMAVLRSLQKGVLA